MKEIELQKDYLNGEEIKTIYFGGGTPSLLSDKEIKLVFEQIGAFFEIANPNPVPSAFVVKYGSNTRSSTADGLRPTFSAS